jgi:hypothetical protein
MSKVMHKSKSAGNVLQHEQIDRYFARNTGKVVLLALDVLACLPVSIQI